MSITTTILAHEDVSHLDKILLCDGLIVPVPAEVLAKIKREHFLLWCHMNAIYVYPTCELIDWLRERIAGRSAIEIGAGKSGIGRALGIRATDSFGQVDNPVQKVYYDALGVPPVQPPSYVEKIDANDAVEKFKPEVIVGAYITQRWLSPMDREGNIYGPLEEEWIGKATYIHIGNRHTHGGKRILSRRHEEYERPWLFTRGKFPERNCIYVWEK